MPLLNVEQTSSEQKTQTCDASSLTAVADPVATPAAAISSARWPWVLVVEDNKVNQELAKEMLEQLGCKVDVVDNGREALNVLQQAHYAMVLMDCQMPDMDGYEAAHEIRRREQDSGAERRLPIVALTANAKEEGQSRRLAAGMDDFLGKPFTQKQLRELLARWASAEHVSLQPTAKRENPVSVVLDSREETAAQVSVLDQKALDNIRALQRVGKPDILQRVIHHYLENAPVLLQNLHEAIAKNDLQAMQMSAHTLKSSSANLGAMVLAERCKELEMMGREKRLEGVAELFHEIKTEYQLATGELVLLQNDVEEVSA